MADLEFSALLRREAQAELERRAVIRDLAESSEWYDAATLAVDSCLTDEVPRVLFERFVGDLLDQDELRDALWAAWVHNKDPMRTIGQRAWVSMFKAAGFFSQGISRVVHHGADGSTHQVEPEFALSWDRPAGDSTVWRGAALNRARRLSWTLHRDCAVNFAEAAAALGFESAIYCGVVPARAVLAVFGDEREQEFVVNPHMPDRPNPA